jgi:arabinose-5-phosphate isomerase
LDIKARMADIIAKEAKAVSAIQVTDAFENALQAMLACKGKIITTGIGKAGYIADKFAATMSSTGTPAFFVHPADAGHGALGMLSEGDCIIAFSTSGNSHEVVEMLKIAPSATIAVMLAISDAIALTLMELKGFTSADYHARHHRGYLGSVTRPPHHYDNDQ